MVPLLLVLTGVTFIASGLGKLRTADPANRFLLEVGVPRALVRPVDRGLSLVEVALGCLLLSGIIARWSAGAAAVLAAVFLAAHIIARMRGSSASCGCFGAIDTDLAPALRLVRSAAFFGMAAVLASGLYAGAGGGGVPVGNVQAVIGGVLSCLTYLLAFRLLNEATALTRHDREKYRRLAAIAAQLKDP